MAVRRIYSFAVGIYRSAVEIYFNFIQHNGFLLSAGIAFFSFLAIFPLLLFIGIALSYLFENPSLQEQILSYIFSRIPSLTSTVKSTIEGLIQERGSAGLIALLGLLWSATGLFSGLSVGLNVVYGVKETRNVVKRYIMAVIFLLIILALFIVSFGATAIVSVLRTQALTEFFPQQVISLAWTVISYAIGFSSTLLLFFTVYYFVPNAKLAFGDIWLGTLLASIAWEIEKYALTFYIDVFASQSFGLVYGSLASIIITLFWINISSMLFMFGAEINVLYKKRQLGNVIVFKPREGRD